jgi:hypothetical protein
VRYRVYGLSLAADRVIPHLVPTPEPDRDGMADVRFDLEPGAGIPDHAIQLVYGPRDAGMRFVVDAGGRHVWAEWYGTPRVRSDADAASILLGPVLGGLLRLRGTVSLHGSVVEVGGSAVVLLGEKGAGKSTLAAALAASGAAVLADDVAALAESPDGGWIAQPGYPRLRAAPDVIDALGAHALDAGGVISGDRKRYIELSGAGAGAPWRFGAEPRPVTAIVELRSGAATAPETREAAGAAAVPTLLRHLRRPLCTPSGAARAAEFGRVSRLAGAVPVRLLTRPDDLDALPEVCAAVAGLAAGQGVGRV